jgi:hypothetical protein
MLRDGASYSRSCFNRAAASVASHVLGRTCANASGGSGIGRGVTSGTSSSGFSVLLSSLMLRVMDVGVNVVGSPSKMSTSGNTQLM